MYRDPAPMANLKKLIGLEPRLKQNLERARSLGQAIERILAAANHHGIELSDDELAAMLHTTRQNMANGKVDDAQLTGVAGGIDIRGMLNGIPAGGAAEGTRARMNRHGIAMGKDESASHLRLAARNGTATELDDEQLAGMAGGRGVFLPRRLGGEPLKPGC